MNAVEGGGVAVEGAGSEGAVVRHGAGLLPARRLVAEREAEFLRVWPILGYMYPTVLQNLQSVSRYYTGVTLDMNP